MFYVQMGAQVALVTFTNLTVGLEEMRTVFYKKNGSQGVCILEQKLGLSCSHYNVYKKTTTPDFSLFVFYM